MASESSFADIRLRFEINVRTLRVFVDEIGTTADEHDKSNLELIGESLNDLFGEELWDAFKAETKRLVAIEKQHNDTPADCDDGGEAGDAAEATEDAAKHDPTPGAKEAISKLFQNPDNIRAFLKTAKQVIRRPPLQGQILRRSAHISLASYFEWLIADLLQAYYLKFPSALPAETRSLTLSDLREIGNIEDAERLLIFKEVDAVLRQNFEDQLAYFQTRLKLGLDALEPYRNQLIEISQRRNSLIHNGGKYARVYIQKVDSDLISQYSAEEGDNIKTDTDYLVRAIDCVFVSGAALLQLCWRRWDKERTAEADGAIVETIYESLEDQRYEVTCALATIAASLAMCDDNSSRIVTINHAIALKRLDRLDQMNELLTSHDWSAVAMRFQVALHALRDEQDELFRLLPKAVAAEEIDIQSLNDWPLFADIREMERFQKLLSEVTSPGGPNADIDKSKIKPNN